MAMNETHPAEVDAYIAGFPDDVQEILRKVRQTIREAAPQAQEKMAYGLPTFTLEGNLVHYGAFKQHIGFYPAPTGIEQFKDEFAVYKGAKGSIQFPLDQPIPYDLIRRVTEFRVQENLVKAEAKRKKRK